MPATSAYGFTNAKINSMIKTSNANNGIRSFNSSAMSGGGSSIGGGSKIGKTKAGGRSPGVQQWHPGMSTPF